MTYIKSNYSLAKISLSVILFLSQLALLPQLLAQAGSSIPLSITSADGIYGSFNPAVFNPLNSEGEAVLMPRGILKLTPEEHYLIWVELESGRLNLLEQEAGGGLVIRKVYPISIGSNGYGKQEEGDKKTPLGIYHFTSFLDDSILTEFYGTGAYPLNYPNILDRRQSRTGSGIWLHGLPKGVEQRPYLDSDGCVVIDNLSLQEMASYIDTGMTHIILTEEDMQWQPVTAVQALRDRLENEFENWRLAWESKNNDEYLAFYAQDFSDLNRNKNEWDTYKSSVNNSKSSIKVNVSNLSFFVDPLQPELISVRYYQHYISNNYSWKGWKEQLWQEKAEGWKIVYEGNG